MKQRFIIFALVALSFGAVYTHVYAHQPNVIGLESAITVVDPEVSKAYYAELAGNPAVYTITSDKSFELYANILVPDISGITKDFSADIKDSSGKELAKLDGEHFDWEHWYEDFAGDWYWKGPEFKQEVPAGTYTIVVSNPTNSGKYVLAPGEEEVFTVAGTPHTIREIYLTKTNFFAKPWYSIYQGIIGKFLLGATIVIILIIILAIYFVRKHLRKKKAHILSN